MTKGTEGRAEEIWGKKLRDKSKEQGEEELKLKEDWENIRSRQYGEYGGQMRQAPCPNSGAGSSEVLAEYV